MIAAAGDWVVRQAAIDCRRLQDAGLPPMRIAVNVAPLQMRRRDFAEHFLQNTRSGLEAGFGLDVEITEGALLLNSDHVTKQLQTLRVSGVRIAIDDFGTGYSSLSRLAQLPIDTLKIDRSFTSRLGVDEAGDTVVATIIQLAAAFRMTTCAEGVETPEQLARLTQLRCDEVQGFLLSRPLPLEQLESLLVGAGCVLRPAGPQLEASQAAAKSAARSTPELNSNGPLRSRTGS
jgi:EAL domain-containing protein (putative c-di-GMP-specific phosphodiesterase class I)